MRTIEALPKSVQITLQVIGAIILLVAALPLFGVMVVIARPLGVLLVLIALPLLLLHRRRPDPRDDPVTEEHHGVRIPPRHLLTAAHAWLTPAAGRGTLVGADDLLLRALGPVEQVILPQPGARLTAGETLFSLRRADRQVDVRVPFAAEVMGRNEALLTQPGLVDASPYRLGWVARVRPAARRAGPSIRAAEEASGWFRKEVDRLLARVAPAPVPAMPDGGVISPDFHELIDAPTWRAVHDEFFS